MKTMTINTFLRTRLTGRTGIAVSPLGVIFAAALFLAITGVVRASSFLPVSTEEHAARAAAIFRGQVVGSESYQSAVDGRIYTRTVFSVTETLKGKTPARIRLVHRGGEAAGRGESDGFSPRFQAGDECLVFVSRNPDGTLGAMRGVASVVRLGTGAQAKAASSAAGAEYADGLLRELRLRAAAGGAAGEDVTDQAADLSTGIAPAGDITPLAVSTATNLLVGSDGIPHRFVLPDRGERIPYLVDADYLPAGMTLTQALYAVQRAFIAWSNVTSFRFSFAGLQSFGQPAFSVSGGDGAVRIQLHDHYNYLATAGGDVLGKGGATWVLPGAPPSAGWTLGGNVAGSDFHKSISGAVVLNHTNSAMQNTNTFAEVLTHEIGHVIGLGHSSELTNEPNAQFKAATMYYLVHADGRGGSVTNWDISVSRQVHPPTNTPPYCYDRVIYAVTQPVGAPSAPGVNSAQVRGYDLQTTNLTFATNDPTGNAGSFVVTGNTVKFVPDAYYQAPIVNPAGSSSYDKVYARYSDGVHASPYATIRVIYLGADSASEGIPDDWRLQWFGSTSPGANQHANNDYDGDGLSNLQEYLLGSNPTNKNHNLRVTGFAATNLQWQAKGYEVYELYSSTNLLNWTRAVNPMLPTNFVGTDFLSVTNSIAGVTGFTNGGPRQYFRILKVP